MDKTLLVELPLASCYAAGFLIGHSWYQSVAWVSRTPVVQYIVFSVKQYITFSLGFFHLVICTFPPCLFMAIHSFLLMHIIFFEHLSLCQVQPGDWASDRGKTSVGPAPGS